MKAENTRLEQGFLNNERCKMNTAKKISKKQKRRVEEAEDNFQRLQKEIAPFAKKRKFKEHYPAEQWVDTYSLDVTELLFN